jgi:hypothetical protein
MAGPQFERPWREQSRSLIPQRLVQTLAMTLGVNEKTIYIRCKSANDLEGLIQGVGKLLPGPVFGFLFESDEVSLEEANQVLAPLHTGCSVIIGFVGPSDLASEINNNWSQCSEFPDNSTFVYGNFVMEAGETPGFLATIHVFDQSEFLNQRGQVFQANDEEIRQLELGGRPSTINIRRIGQRQK